MKIEKRKFYGKLALGVMSVSIFLTGCGSKVNEVPEKEVENMSLVERIDKKAEYTLKDSNSYSIQYALYDNGKIVTSGVKGKAGEKLDKDTVYGIGSVSKVYAAAAVMKLVDEGKINLDEPVIKYIPEFTMKDNRYKKITPRMLLNHSSGLRGNDVTNEILLDDNDTHANTSLLESLKEQTLKAKPGAYSVYCNSGFSLAERLVEEVSGLSFTEYLDKNFMKPLDMKNSGTPQSKIDKNQFAKFYMPDGKEMPKVELCNAIGSGGVISTAEDMLKYSEIFMGKHEEILSDKSVKEMEGEEYKKGMWPGDVDDSNNYGLGWDSVKLYPFSEYGIKALAKGGDISTYHASFVVLPEKNMSAMVLSTDGSSMNNQALATEMLLQALKEKGEIKEFKEAKSFGKPVAQKISKATLENLGHYIASESRYEARIDDEEILTLTNELDTKYIHVGDGKFVSENGLMQIQFVKEKNGKTYIWKQVYSDGKELPQMADSGYIAEKLVKNTVKPEVAKIWKEREGKIFYIINEKYTSDSYVLGPLFAPVDDVDIDLGYWGDKKILDENNAVSEVQIPGLEGRDTVEAKFYKDKDIEYISHSGYIGMAIDGMKSLNQNEKIRIEDSGYAKWFLVPKNLEGKTITVTMSENGGFTVFDAEDEVVNSSYLTGTNEMKLPVGGKLVFAGNVGSEFKITIK